MIFETATAYGSSLALLTLLHGCCKWHMIASPYNTMDHANSHLQEVSNLQLDYISEGSVSHINGVWSSFLDFTASFVENKQNMSHVQPCACVTNPFKRLPCFRTSGLFSSSLVFLVV